jgi:ATP-binding cassette subfamily B protein
LFRHYLDIVDAPDDLSNGSTVARPLMVGIQCEDVWFRYQPDAPWVFAGLNMEIPAGATLGVVGLNGAGKSTLVKLLCRFYDPTHGRITWDGRDIREFDLASLRDRISATFQDYGEYDLTAGENIGLGDITHIDDAHAVERAARLAAIHDVVNTLPEGYQTMLSRAFRSEAGSSTMLSTGQWQRVALARAFVRSRADLMILDEPTASLDAIAEEKLFDGLKRARAGMTTLVVCHRLSAMANVDKIAVFASRQITEFGTHDELITSGGEYARVFATQARHYLTPHGGIENTDNEVRNVKTEWTVSAAR